MTCAIDKNVVISHKFFEKLLVSIANFRMTAAVHIHEYTHAAKQNDFL